MTNVKMNRLVIIGASGHGKVIADIAEKIGYQEIVFLDDNENLVDCAGYPVIGKTCDALDVEGDKIVAIGNAEIRKFFLDRITAVTLIHPDAMISRRVEIGVGTVVMAGAVINSDTKIGKGCIINTCSSIDHDCIIEDYVHISVGAHVAGSCCIGKMTWIGAGTTISNNITVCSNSMVGAGAVVIKNLEEAGTYVGVPAERKKR